MSTFLENKVHILWSVNDVVAGDPTETAGKPATLGFRQKDQIEGISSSKLYLHVLGLKMQLIWSFFQKPAVSSAWQFSSGSSATLSLAVHTACNVCSAEKVTKRSSLLPFLRNRRY